MGVDNDGIQSIETLLVDNGIEQKDIELVKRSIIGIAREISEESRAFELSKKNKDYLEKDKIVMCGGNLKEKF